MKKKYFSLCMAVLSACTLFACGNADETSLPAETAEGYFLLADSGTPMIIMDSGAATMSAEDDSSIFDGFTDGDVIKIEFDGGIAESYPMQIHHIRKVTLVKDGTYENIPADELAGLASMGYIAPETFPLTGRYLLTENTHLLFYDDGQVITMHPAETVMDTDLFAGLTDGDRITVECDNILTTYPGQTAVYSCTFVEDGTYDDLPEESLDTLRELGWTLE